MQFIVLTSPKSEAGGEFVYNKLHNMQYIPLKQHEDRLNSQTVVFGLDDEPSPVCREDDVLPAPSEEVELHAVRPIVKTVSLDRAMDSLPASGIKRRNSFSGPGERTAEITEVVREKRSYSFSQPAVSHAPLELPSQDAVATEDQQQRKRTPGMKKEKRHSSKAWTTNNAAMRLLKQQRKLALRQIWGLLRQQIFLGMAASSVPVRRDVPNTKEDLDVAGIRFVYFSAQNMKRSKPVAEKLGIQFDWNCAISLRNLDAQESHDPHRHISSYADWDVLGKHN
ncbi:hypothetical protein EON65_18110 [archaeon]|nr:MAG: hypothetical protein EON65_18110 [archaeon]